MKILYSFFCLLIIPHFLFSQTSMREYSVSQSLNYSNIIKTTDDKYGYAAHASTKEHISSVMIAKFGRSFQPEWFNFYTDSMNTAGTDLRQRITACKNGGFAVAFTPGTGDKSVYAIKTDSSGNLVWNKKYYLNSASRNTVLLEKYNGNIIIVTGLYASSGIGLLSINSNNGQIQSFRSLTIANFGNYLPGVIKSTKDSGYVLAGSDDGYGSLFIARYDKDDSLMWTRKFQVPYQGAYYSQSIADIIETNDGGFAFTGQVPSAIAGNGYDVSLIKLTKDGNLQWAKDVGTASEDAGFSVLENSDSSYTVCGYGSSNTWLMRLNKTADASIFQTGIPAAYFSFPSAIQDNSGKYIVAGTTLTGKYLQARGFITTVENNGVSCAGVPLNQSITTLTISKITATGKQQNITSQATADTAYFKKTTPGITSKILCNSNSLAGQRTGISVENLNSSTALNAEIINNPVKTIMQLKFSGRPSSSGWLVTVSDMQGKKIITQNIESNYTSRQIDVSTLTPGLYIVNVANASWHKSIKAMIIN